MEHTPPVPGASTLTEAEKEAKYQKEKKEKDKIEKKKKKKAKEYKELIAKEDKERILNRKKGEATYKKNVADERKYFGKAFQVGYNIGYAITKQVNEDMKDAKLVHAPEEDDDDEITRLEQELADDVLALENEESTEDYDDTPIGEGDMPAFIVQKIHNDLGTYGVSENEIRSLGVEAAMNLLRRKILEKELMEPPQEKTVTPAMLRGNFSLLKKMRKEALGALKEVSTDIRIGDLVRLVKESPDDPKPLEEYLKNQLGNLNPQERFFVEVSIEINRFRARYKEMKGENVAKVTKEETNEQTNNNQN